jgi:hypothetical protein
MPAAYIVSTNVARRLLRMVSGPSPTHGQRRGCADFVEKVCFEIIVAAPVGGRTCAVIGASPQVVGVGAVAGISMASLRRFWAVAAR